jgi:hypothetical protein
LRHEAFVDPFSVNVDNRTAVGYDNARFQSLGKRSQRAFGTRGSKSR